MFRSNQPIRENEKGEKNEKSDRSSVNDEKAKEDEESYQTNIKTIQVQQAIQEYVQEKKNIYDNLIKYLESDDNIDQNLQNLINIYSQQKHEEPQDELDKFLQLLISIANNCHRNETLFNKIIQLIESYENQIKQTFTNEQIFNIFESNKKLLHFLFKKKIITIDKTICDELYSKQEPNYNCYRHFFYPEIKSFIGEQKSEPIEKELLEKDSEIFENFEDKREEGENDTFICSLIRKDSIEDFIKHINHTNISLDSVIKPSIFETNSFLNENKNISLIEYASFFGSIQIIQYLILNKVELKPSLWLYAIHSRNAELFHLLEENKIEPPLFNDNNNNNNNNNIHFKRFLKRKKYSEYNDNNNKYLKCFCESIKCHHNEFANYIEDNFLLDDKGQIRKNENFLSSIMEFHNYAYFPSDFDDGDEFYYLCSNNYHKLVNLFIKKKKESIEKVISDNNNDYKTILINAAKENRIEIIYFVLLIQQSIPDDCFKDLKDLKKIAIPSSVTSIGKSAFLRCSSLKKITIPSSVTSIGEEAFRGCSSLTQITIPSSVTKIESYAFSGCSSLTKVTIPSSVTEIGSYAFWGCSSLTQITIPSSVTSIGDNAFLKCSSLTQITIPSSVTSIGEDAFRGCSSLTQIAIPSSFESIRSSIFADCTSLSQITIFPCKENRVKLLDNQLLVHKRNLRDEDFDTLIWVNKSAKTINIPSFIKIIHNGAFRGCSLLTEISIPSSVTKLEQDSFKGCSSLTKVTIPSSIKRIGATAFSGCSSLTQITIPSSVTEIGSFAFSGCSSLTQISIPSSVTEIGPFAFDGCSSLTQITIPSSVTEIGSAAFSGCSSLTQIKIPSSLNIERTELRSQVQIFRI